MHRYQLCSTEYVVFSAEQVLDPSHPPLLSWGLVCIYAYDISQLNGSLGSLPFTFWCCRIPVKYSSSEMGEKTI